MTEFETLKNALTRMKHELNVMEWKNINASCIKDFTAQVTYYFNNNQLDDMENDK